MRGRSRIGTVALMTIISVTLAGCGGGGGTPSSPATVRGTVLDDGTLEPIAGATVQTGTASAQTAADGTFSLQTEAGGRVLTFTATGYRQLQANVSLQAGVNQIGARHLQPALTAGRGAVSGIVRRGGGPAGGATIRSGNATAVSRSDGTFSIYNVAAGSQGLTAVSADGRATGSVLVDIQAGATTSGVTINLGLAPPPPPVL